MFRFLIASTFALIAVAINPFGLGLDELSSLQSPHASTLLPRDNSVARPWILALTANYTRALNNARPSPTCYDYPDSSNTLPQRTYPYATSVNLTCWTHQARYRPYVDCAARCNPQYEATWFKTAEGCWIPDWDITLPVTGAALGQQLSDLLIYCPHTLRQSSVFRSQYTGQTYCYSCPSLGCSAQSFVGMNGGADLQCWKAAEDVRGDTTWWRVISDGKSNGQCWLPNQVFNPYYFNGNAHECGV